MTEKNEETIASSTLILLLPADPSFSLLGHFHRWFEHPRYKRALIQLVDLGRMRIRIVLRQRKVVLQGSIAMPSIDAV